MSREISAIKATVDQCHSTVQDLLSKYEKFSQDQPAELEKTKEAIVASVLESVKASVEEILKTYKKEAVAEATASIRADIDAKLDAMKTSVLQSLKTKASQSS